MKKNILVGLLLTAVIPSHAGNWSLGGGALIAANPYLSMKTNILPIPFISYQGEYVSVYGPIAKLRYSVNKNNILGLRFQLGMQEFDPKETKNIAMQSLDKRQRLLFIGPYHRLRTDYGQLTTSFGYDVSTRSNGGMLADLQYGYPFKSKSRKFFIRPGLGVTWFNNSLSSHYYQVSKAETIRSGLNQYKPSGFVQPFLSLFAGISLSKKIFWTNIARLNYLPNAIHNSPMVADKRFTYSLITGITYEIGDEKQR